MDGTDPLPTRFKDDCEPAATRQTQVSISPTEWILFAAVVCGLIGLHLGTIHHQSFFIDEVEELEFAKGDFWASVFMPDSMPPLFTVTLRAWLNLVGDDSGARWLSALGGLIGTLITWRVSRVFMSPMASMVATLFFTFSPLQLYYAQLVRGYSLMTLFGCLAIGAFLLADATGKIRYWILFTASCALGMYTHYYFVMIPMSIVAGWILLNFSGRRDWIHWRWLVIACLVLMCVAFSLWIFLRIDFQYQHDLRAPRPLSISALAYTYLSLFGGYALGPSQRELHAANANVLEALPWLVMIGLASIPLICMGLWKGRRLNLLTYLVCLLVLPFVAIGTVGLVSGITYNVRFVCWMTFPLSMLLALAFEPMASPRSLSSHPKLAPFASRNQLPWLLAIFVLGIFGFANYQRVFEPRYQFEDTRAVAAFLENNWKENDRVFVVSDYVNPTLEYYMPDRANAMFELPEPSVRSEVFSEPSVVDRALGVMKSESLDRYWFIYSRPFHGDPSGLFLNALEKCGVQFDREFSGIRIYHGYVSDLPP